MKTLLVLALALAVVGCAAPSGTTASGRPALRPADVVFYASERDVPGEYEVIEVLVPPDDIARVGSGYDSSDAVERYARRRAAALGANGVLSVNTAEADSDSRAAAVVRNGYTLSQTHMVAIYVTAAAPSQ